MKLFVLFSFFLTSFVLTAQVTPLVGTYLGDGQRNYYGNAAPSRLRVHWKVYLGSGNTRLGRMVKHWKGAGWTGQPLVIREGNEIFLIQGSLGHHLKKIRARDGKVIWSTNVGDAIKGTPTFAHVGGRDPEKRYVLITGSRMGYQSDFISGTAYSLSGISYATGKILWRHNSRRTGSNSRDVDASALMIGSKACVPLENGYFTVFPLIYLRHVIGVASWHLKFIVRHAFTGTLIFGCLGRSFLAKVHQHCTEVRRILQLVVGGYTLARQA